MRNTLFGMVMALILVFGVQYCQYQRDQAEVVKANSSLVQKQLNNVSKLIVSEGNYAQVFTFEDSKKFYFDIFSADKKALVVVNATAQISYDLSKIETEISEETQTVHLLHIPQPELLITPDIEYYDVSQDYLNQFDAADYNKIKERVMSSLSAKIEASTLATNAENRLLAELQKIYVLTNSMGWTLEYNQEQILHEDDLEQLLDAMH